MVWIINALIVICVFVVGYIICLGFGWALSSIFPGHPVKKWWNSDPYDKDELNN